MGLFDEHNIFELEHTGYPGERLIACHNTVLGAKRANDREALLCKTEKELKAIATRVKKGDLTGKDEIGLAVGAVINKQKMKKHFKLKIEDRLFTYVRNEESIRKESLLDGIYVLRTSLPSEEHDAQSCVRSYKRLTEVEKAFRTMKSPDLNIRPIYHYTEDRVRTHLFICMLAYYVQWHMQQIWSELTFTDEEKDLPANPVLPAKRSGSARKKDSTKKNEDGLRVRKFDGVMKALSALSRITYEPGSGGPSTHFKLIARKTPFQERALHLIESYNMYP
jgi:hypothetical protein